MKVLERAKKPDVSIAQQISRVRSQSGVRPFPAKACPDLTGDGQNKKGPPSGPFALFFCSLSDWPTYGKNGMTVSRHGQHTFVTQNAKTVYLDLNLDLATSS